MIRIATLIASLLFSLSAWCAPQLTWLNTVHDFGAFSEDLNTVSCSFRAVNTGTEPVAVVSTRATCGCTAPKYSKEAVQPGDTLTLLVEFNAVGRPGRFSKKVYVDTSDGDKAVLIVNGTVVGSSATLASRYPVDAGSARLSNSIVAFGQTYKGGNLYGAINIYNTGSEPIHPLAINLPPYIKAQYRPSEIAPGEQGSIALTANTAAVAEWGTVEGSFTLIPSQAAPSDTVRITTVMILREDFRKLTPEQLDKAPKAKLSADAIDFDRITSPTTRTLKITNTGHEPLLVRRVETAEPALTPTISSTKIAPGKSATLAVKLNPSLLTSSEPLNARVQLIVNDPENPIINIRVLGY